MTPLGLRQFKVITMLVFGFIRNEIHLSVPEALMLEAGCWILDIGFWILVIGNGFDIMFRFYIFDYHVVVYSLYISLVMQSSDKC